MPRGPRALGAAVMVALSVIIGPAPAMAGGNGPPPAPEVGANGGGGLCGTPVVGTLCAVADPIGTATKAVTAIPSAMADGASDALARWIASGAAGFLEHAGKAIFSGTEVNLSDTGEGGRPWFLEHYQRMAAVGLALFAPMLILAVLQAVFSQSLGLLGRAVANLPIAAIGTAAAVAVVGLLLGATDHASTFIAGGLGADSANFLTGIVATLLNPVALTGPGGAGMFGVALLGVFMALAAFVVWLELLVREASIYLTVLFLPVAFATYIWPALSAWLRRLVEVIVALILSKLVIVAALSLAGSALAAQEGFAALVSGAGMLMLAAFAPFALFKLIPIASMAAISPLEGQGRRSIRAAVPRASTAFYVRQLATSGSRSRNAASSGTRRAAGEGPPPPPALGRSGRGPSVGPGGGRGPVGSGAGGAASIGATGLSAGGAMAVGGAAKATRAATAPVRRATGQPSTDGSERQ